MSVLTIRNVSEELVKKIKKVAKLHNISMEQEIRNLLNERFIEKINGFGRSLRSHSRS